MQGQYYGAKPILAGATEDVGNRVAGFLASAAGTVTITTFGGVSLVTAMPVVAGFNRLGITFGSPAGNTLQASVDGCILI